MQTIQTDVCVVAAGPSGLAAAIAAAEKGARVTVLEKTGRSGGAGNMAMGLFGIETDQTRRAMSELTAEKAYARFMEYTHYRSDSRLVRDYLMRAGDTIRWLEAMGVRFSAAVKYFPSSEATWHLVTPPPGLARKGHAAVMMQRMTERAQALDVRFLYETPAERLETDAQGVKAVLAKTKDGETLCVKCHAAILCTGGFGGDKAQLRERLGLSWGDDICSISLPFSTGDGLRMAREAGAAEERPNLEIMYTKPGRPCTVSQCLWRQPKALVLNRDGERVFSEEVLENTTFTGNSILQQPKRRVYSIIDSGILSYYRAHPLDLSSNVWAECTPDEFLSGLNADLESGVSDMWRASSLEELAAQTGLDAAALLQAVAGYNRGCAEGRDEFFKSARHLLPLNGPEYYAIRFAAGGYGTLGGVRIDRHMRVLDGEWQALGGLYAAGTDACGIFGDSYVFVLPGSTLGFCVGSGRIAGENAALYVKEQH